MNDTDPIDAPVPDSPAWDALREIQQAPDHIVPPLAEMLTIKEVMALFPPGTVSADWLRKHIPGKRRVGRWHMWPRSAVNAYLNDMAIRDAG